MRTTIKIVGLGNRLTGTSKKTNKPYDFQPVSFLYDDPYTTGFKAATANISGDMIDPLGGLHLDEEREIFYHTYNNSVVVDGIL